MNKNVLRRVANRMGVDFHRFSGWRWSYHVKDYYPVRPSPRWGYGKPQHAKIADALNRQRNEFEQFIDTISVSADVLSSIRSEGDPSSNIPYWSNTRFGNLDAAVLVTMLLSNTPRRYLEIGSGNSTKVAHYAVNRAKLTTTITSVDPHPRAEVDHLCDTVIRQRLEDCDLSLFDDLESGDILFFDGTHRIFTNSDVTAFFLDVMPRLKAGVIVQIHDIFLPSDYPPGWNRRMYSEQYLLAAMLLCPQPPFHVLFPSFFVSVDDRLRGHADHVLSAFDCKTHGGSFWVAMN